MRKGVKRPVGVRIKAKCEKNKIGWPMRECEVDIIFGYGVDDVTSNLRFLGETGYLSTVGVTARTQEAITEAAKETYRLDGSEFRKRRREIEKAVHSAWKEVEERFKPRRKKYGT